MSGVPRACRGFAGGMQLQAIQNDRAAVDALIRRPMASEELAREIGVAPRTAWRIIRRLSERGLTVEALIDPLFVPRRGAPTCTYRIIMPKGRVCAEPGCGTILRRTNPADRCELHGGGTTDALFADWGPSEASQLDEPRRCPRCGEETQDFSPNGSYCRPCACSMHKEWYARQEAKETA